VLTVERERVIGKFRGQGTCLNNHILTTQKRNISVVRFSFQEDFMEMVFLRTMLIKGSYGIFAKKNIDFHFFRVIIECSGIENKINRVNIIFLDIFR
jgi:hypothetical protein